MNILENKTKCTGCTACINKCPKNAIKMELDEEGFLYPVIDKEKCINCGLCKKNCPVLNTKENKSLNECYVGYTEDKTILEKSSSGGIFSVIANKVLEDDGIVIGAAFDENNKLNHIAVTKKEELEKLKGSKYLQSNLNNIFTFIKDNLKDKKILFVGTLCQVAGLKAFLPKNSNNLICIDLICHGVPSSKVFEKYIKELEDKNKDKVINVDFRDKRTGWGSYSTTVKMTKNEISEMSKDNIYSKIFLRNIALRENCYNCNFKLGNKYSDITLGDFWGVKNYYPEMYKDSGVSAIIINTEKGNEIFNSINNNLIYKKCKLEEILSGNPSLKESSKRPKKRNDFFKEIDNYGLYELERKYKNKQCIVKRIIKKLYRVFIK